MCASACASLCVFVSKACESVSISPWQHSSKTEPVRGLCLTSLFNQTQTHTSGQPGPRYLPLPPSARCTHPVLSPPLSPLLAFPPPPPLQFSTPVHHIVSRLFIFPHFLCPAPCAPLHPLLLPTPASPGFALSPRDVTFSTVSGAAASKLGQNWPKMCTRSVWCP